jgi:DNA-binding GntR family transcriptional regulator
MNKRITKTTLVDQVYNYLRDRIVRLEIKLGERLDVRKLSEQLGVSQTPIREALQKLVEQGLVSAKPYTGYFVVELTPRDIEELFDLRKALELVALKYIVKNNYVENLLHDLLSRLNELEKITSYSLLVEKTRQIDEDLHFSFLIQAANNKWLTKIANGVFDLIKITSHLSVNPKAALKEHRDFLLAVANGDIDKAAAILESHLERAKKDSLETWVRQSAEAK